MNTLESTISILQSLPKSDVNATSDITYATYSKIYFPIHPISRQQMLNDLAISRAQEESGYYKDFSEAIYEIELKYGL
jgi:hypothetical protein